MAAYQARISKALPLRFGVRYSSYLEKPTTITVTHLLMDCPSRVAA